MENIFKAIGMLCNAKYIQRQIFGIIVRTLFWKLDVSGTIYFQASSYPVFVFSVK